MGRAAWSSARLSPRRVAWLECSWWGPHDHSPLPADWWWHLAAEVLLCATLILPLRLFWSQNWMILLEACVPRLLNVQGLDGLTDTFGGLCPQVFVYLSLSLFDLCTRCHMWLCSQPPFSMIDRGLCPWCYNCVILFDIFLLKTLFTEQVARPMTLKCLVLSSLAIMIWTHKIMPKP